MDKIRTLLSSVNASWDNALKVTIFVTDMRYFAEGGQIKDAPP